MNSKAKAAVLAFSFALCAASALITHVARVRMPAPAPRELYAVVNRQIAAFRSGDFPSAYRYAATGVQQKFTLAQFAAMIRRDYPELARARDIEFGQVHTRGASAVVQVFFSGRDKLSHSVFYNLVAENGVWKIAGADEIRTARPRQFIHA